MPGGGTPVPPCGVSSPFRGHLSTKSNAFCIGQSCRLSDQYRVRDHLLTHYNKILTAKAAVDCSPPESLIKSIKYSDQRRRERLKKEVTRLERDPAHSRASSRPHSRESLDSASHHKEHYVRHSPRSDPGPSRSLSSSPFFSSPSPEYTRGLRLPSGLQSSSSSHWTATGSAPRRFQDNQQKTYSGDLLERHAPRFTAQPRPFTPRTLRSDATSRLAQSRHYAPPRRRRTAPAEESRNQQRRSDLNPEHHHEEEEEDVDHLLESEEDDQDYSERRPISTSRMSFSDLKSPSPALRRIRAEEEELAYLNFVADVTNEILSLGLFSDRVIDRVFDRHLEENRHRLEEGKMRHLLAILRADLDSNDNKNLNLFADHSFHTATDFREPDAAKNNGFSSRDFSLEDQNSRHNFREESSSYLNRKSPLRTDVLSSQSTKSYLDRGTEDYYEQIVSSTSTKDDEVPRWSNWGSKDDHEKSTMICGPKDDHDRSGSSWGTRDNHERSRSSRDSKDDHERSGSIQSSKDNDERSRSSRGINVDHERRGSSRSIYNDDHERSRSSRDSKDDRERSGSIQSSKDNDERSGSSQSIYNDNHERSKSSQSIYNDDHERSRSSRGIYNDDHERSRSSQSIYNDDHERGRSSQSIYNDDHERSRSSRGIYDDPERSGSSQSIYNDDHESGRSSRGIYDDHERRGSRQGSNNVLEKSRHSQDSKGSHERSRSQSSLGEDKPTLQKNSDCPEEDQLYGKSSPVDNVILEDSHMTQRSVSPDVAAGLQSDHDYKDELKDLERGFSESVQVSEDGADPKKQAGVASDQDIDYSDDEDF